MNKNIITSIIITAVVFGAGGFYGGMKYAASKGLSLQNLENLTPEQRQQLFQQSRSNVSGNSSTGRRTGTNGQPGGGFTSGDIIARDDKSITIKMPDGSSKIIFYSGSTQISKSASGVADDLQVGKTVQINGTANSDGSITAQNIQLRNPLNQPSQ
jgi:hypothetical protein